MRGRRTRRGPDLRRLAARVACRAAPRGRTVALLAVVAVALMVTGLPRRPRGRSGRSRWCGRWWSSWASACCPAGRETRDRRPTGDEEPLRGAVALGGGAPARPATVPRHSAGRRPRRPRSGGEAPLGALSVTVRSRARPRGLRQRATRATHAASGAARRLPEAGVGLR
ncbi:hypothetical protein ACFQV4_12830 [Streptomyces thermocarboxydus]